MCSCAAVLLCCLHDCVWRYMRYNSFFSNCSGYSKRRPGPRKNAQDNCGKHQCSFTLCSSTCTNKSPVLVLQSSLQLLPTIASLTTARVVLLQHIVTVADHCTMRTQLRQVKIHLYRMRCVACVEVCQCVDRAAVCAVVACAVTTDTPSRCTMHCLRYCYVITAIQQPVWGRGSSSEATQQALPVLGVPTELPKTKDIHRLMKNDVLKVLSSLK
jgi:hypothetical protein